MNLGKRVVKKGDEPPADGKQKPVHVDSGVTPAQLDRVRVDQLSKRSAFNYCKSNKVGETENACPNLLNKDSLKGESIDLASLKDNKAYRINTNKNAAQNNSIQSSELKVYIEKRKELDELSEDILDDEIEFIKYLDRMHEYQELLVSELVSEVEKLEEQKDRYEVSIKDTNAKLETVNKSIAESNLANANEYKELLREKTGKSTEKDQSGSKSKEIDEEKKIEDLEQDLISMKKTLNAKMIELQKVVQEIKEDNQNKDVVDKEFEELKQNLELYSEISERLQFDNNEIIDRKRYLNNEVQMSIGNIKFNLNLRQSEEVAANSFLQVLNEDDTPTLCVKYPEQQQPQSRQGDGKIKEQKYPFERIYLNDQTDKMFEDLSPLLLNFIDGFGVNVFLYGQSGSGKSYSILRETDGLLPRSVGLIFEKVEFLRSLGWSVNVSVAALQISNFSSSNNVDNMNMMGNNMNQQDSNNNFNANQMNDLIDLITGDSVPDFSLKEVESKENLIELLSEIEESQKNSELAEKYRANIYQLSVHCIHKNGISDIETRGFLNFVDLPSSDSPKENQADGINLQQEFMSSGLQMKALYEVVNSLLKREKNVPFKNSTLTSTLQPYLGKDCKIFFIFNL